MRTLVGPQQANMFLFLYTHPTQKHSCQQNFRQITVIKTEILRTLRKMLWTIISNRDRQTLIDFTSSIKNQREPNVRRKFVNNTLKTLSLDFNLQNFGSRTRHYRSYIFNKKYSSESFIASQSIQSIKKYESKKFHSKINCVVASHELAYSTMIFINGD